MNPAARRHLAGALAAAAGVAAVSAGTVLAAAPAGANGSAPQACKANSDRYTATVTSGLANVRVGTTHGRIVRIAAGKSRTTKGSLPEIAVLRPRVKGAGASAAAVLTAAEKTLAKAGRPVDLAAPGARTPSGPYEVNGTSTYGPTGSARVLAEFHGYRVWAGKWQRVVCGADGASTRTSGTWSSFGKVVIDGAVECTPAAVATAKADAATAWRAKVCAAVLAAEG